MEAIIFIALVIIIILLFNISSFNKTAENNSLENFRSLKKEIEALKEALKKTPVPEEKVRPTDEDVVQWRPSIPHDTIKHAIQTSPPQPIVDEVEEEEVVEQSSPAIEPIAIEPIAPAKDIVSPPAAQESWSERWKRNNPDLEKFIGENLINKIGIAVLVLGVAFFVKYAIDQDWIKETGRVCIGIGCGIVLVGLAHYLRNSYRSFSSVLAGGGISIFYFTIAFAFHQYQLFSQTAAFIIMAVITIFAVVLSLLYDKAELAIIATIGGFITPFLLSTGSGNYMVLFTYLVILNAGMLALSYFKQWKAINVISLFFTMIIYGAWLGNELFANNEFSKYKNALIFATIFYLLFLAMNLVYNVRKQLPFKGFDFSLLLLITFGYYAAGMLNLNYWNQGAYQGLFTLILGIINFSLAWLFYRSEKVEKNLLYFLIGLTLTFISLAAPVQLHGHSITIFWSAEFVLLYWLHQKSGIKVFKYAAAIIMLLMIISLLIDWSNANEAVVKHLPVLYHTLPGFITNVFAIAAFTIFTILLRKSPATDNWILGIKNSRIIPIMAITAIAVLYLTCVFGVNLYFYNNASFNVPNAWHQLVTYSFAILVLSIAAKYRLGINAVMKLVIIGACVAFYLFSIPLSIDLRNMVLADSSLTIHLWIHWLAAALLIFLIYKGIQIYRTNALLFQHLMKNIVWLFSIVLVIIFTMEVMHTYIFSTAAVQVPKVAFDQYLKAGVTIVWALCSFAIMWIGMKHKFKTLRIISLFVFSVALLKLFLYDIRNISEGGKIAAFIMLGVLLLIISFMYQKLKKIIIDDNAS